MNVVAGDTVAAAVPIGPFPVVLVGQRGLSLDWPVSVAAGDATLCTDVSNWYDGVLTRTNQSYQGPVVIYLQSLPVLHIFCCYGASLLKLLLP